MKFISKIIYIFDLECIKKGKGKFRKENKKWIFLFGNYVKII